MKIRWTGWIFIIGFLAGCSQQSKDHFTVTGTIHHNPGKQTVYLDAVELGGAAPLTLDTTIISGDDASFNLKGLATQEGVYRLRFERDNFFVLLVNDKSKLDFEADWNDFGNYSINSPGSNSFRNLLKMFNERLVMIDSLRTGIMNLRTSYASDSAKLVAENDFRTYVTETEDMLMNYADTTHSVGVALYALGIVKGQAEPERLENLIDRLSKKYPHHPEVQKIASAYATFLQQKEAQNIIGKPAPEINLPDTAGNLVSLGSFKGKYVLVDFWASWCAPCRAENPNVVANYEKFKNKNFTVLGVSLDKDKKAWKEAIEEDHLNWTHISDLKFWNSQVVEPYHIEGIPFNVLVDPTGKIVASNLRGSALSQKLQEVLP